MTRIVSAIIITFAIAAAGVTAMADIPDTPNLPLDHNSGVPSSVIDEIASLYESASDSIIKELRAGALDPLTRGQEFKRGRAAELLARIERIQAQFGRSLAPKVNEAARVAWFLGARHGMGQLRELGLRDRDLPAQGTFAAIDERSVEVVARDIFAASMQAMGDHAGDAKRLLRAISSTDISDVEVSRRIAKGIITGDPRQAIRDVRELFREPGGEESYRKLGNRQITVGRATFSVRAYSEMLVRTRTREAVVQARHQRLTGAGITLVIITGRVSKNFCTRYLGMICSIEGSHPKWPALSSLNGPPFHPNCSKGTRPYSEELSPPDEARNGERALQIAQSAGFDTREPVTGEEQGAIRRLI